MSDEDPIIQSNKDPLPALREQRRREEHISRYDGIAITSGAAAAAALVGCIMLGYAPFIPIAVVFLVLYKVREYRSSRSIMITSGIVFGLWFLISVSGLLFPFIMGLLIAYLFNPIITKLHKRFNIPRAWSSIVIVLVLCAIIGFLGWLIAPVAVNQAESLLRNLADFFEHNSYEIDEISVRRFMVSIGIPDKYVTSYLNEQLYPAVKHFAGMLPELAINLVSALPSVAHRIIDLILIPIATIYFLKDWPYIGENILWLLPPTRRPHWKNILANIDKVLYQYIRGQSTVALIMGVLAGTIFMLFGVPYSVLLAVIIAFFDLIPIVGLIVSIAVVETVIMITMPITAGNIVIGVATILGLHMLEAYILGPRIVGRGVGIPPILIIISVFIFGYFLGFFGMLIAVPTTGILLLFIREYRDVIPPHIVHNE